MEYNFSAPGRLSHSRPTLTAVGRNKWGQRSLSKMVKKTLINGNEISLMNVERKKHEEHIGHPAFENDHVPLPKFIQ